MSNQPCDVFFILDDKDERPKLPRHAGAKDSLRGFGGKMHVSGFCLVIHFRWDEI
jgi:hypothetical protein